MMYLLNVYERESFLRNYILNILKINMNNRYFLSIFAVLFDYPITQISLPSKFSLGKSIKKRLLNPFFFLFITAYNHLPYKFKYK